MPSSAIIIPPSETFVDVSIIDTKSYFGPLGVEYFLKPGPVGAHKTVGAAFYCFLVHHKPSNTRLLFDLALRKDVENLSRSMRKSIEQGGWEVNVPTDIADILSSNTVPLESINGIVWSHHHWDHIGDPSTFPSTTSLIVGSGFKDEFLPAYPENPDSPLTQDAILGREVVEPDFKGTDIIQIGGYAAVDYFKDGSFYFLDTPGHTIGHVSALACTTAGDDSTFMLLGGDVAHHAGEFRPSPFEPMPAEIRPDPRKPAFQSNGNGSFCPGSMFERVHRGALERSMDPRTTPFYQTTGAHDEVVAANEWKAKGWKREGHWRFLSDFI
ncbi:hypothetical protein FOZG_10237 [Fusarium oxysporum Fo47]|uniref:Metallo-beta-lactamase domain-containing protein n=1 Tax=Fusarium oxysporum Fo47 TaxID=660027 RepID=W9K2Z2_FUSOX|nr:hypothetical protein FOZG_10237 [Fusarium oxysporum Fo47]